MQDNLLFAASIRDNIACAARKPTIEQIEAAAHLANAHEFIVATDNGLLHQMRRANPHKRFIEAPTAGASATCKSCAHCPWMAMNGLANLLATLQQTHNEIHVDAATGDRARIR